MTRRVWVLVGLLLCACLCAGCFGTVCTVQPTVYTDAEGAIVWQVTTCHPRLTVRWR